MKHWTVRKRLLASFAAIIAILLILATSVFAMMLAIDRQVTEVRESATPGMLSAARMRVLWADHLLETQRLFLLRDGAAIPAQELEERTLRLRAITRQMDDTWRDYLAANATTVKLDANPFEVAYESYFVVFDRVLDLTNRGQLGKALTLGRRDLLPAWQGRARNPRPSGGGQQRGRGYGHSGHRQRSHLG